MLSTVVAAGNVWLTCPCARIAPNWSICDTGRGGHGGGSTEGREPVWGSVIIAPGPREETRVQRGYHVLLYGHE